MKPASRSPKSEESWVIQAVHLHFSFTWSHPPLFLWQRPNYTQTKNTAGKFHCRKEIVQFPPEIEKFQHSAGFFSLYTLFIRCCGEYMYGKAESHLGCRPVNPSLCTWINIDKNKSFHQVRVAELWGESRGTLRRMIQPTQGSTAGAAAGKLLAKGSRQS